MTSERPERRETDWLWNELDALRAQLTEQHRNIRMDMNAGFAKVAQEVKEGISGIDRRVTDHSGRLIVIETERGIEKSQAIRRGTWAGLAAASGITVLMKLVEHYLGKP